VAEQAAPRASTVTAVPPSRRSVAAVGLLLVVTACDVGSGAAPAAGPPPSATVAPDAAPDVAPMPSTGAPPTGTPPPTGDPSGDDGTLTLAFGGDVHFARQLAPLLDDPSTALAELRPYLGEADLAVVNLETALTTRGAPAPKSFHFRAPPTALDALAAAGVDVVTMANNHAVDYGAEGLVDTLAARRESPVPVVGVGEDEADAYAPALVQAEGQRVAVLGATQVPDWTASTQAAGRSRPGVAVSLDPTRLVRAVRRARAEADVVVVYLHWGTDYTGCPDPAQRRTARALADAGADVVVGTHAHQVQGSGWLGSTYVGYGLGNFVWWRRNSPVQAASGVLTLTLRGRQVVADSWQPLEVSADGLPRRPGRARERALLADVKAARECSDLAAAAP